MFNGSGLDMNRCPDGIDNFYLKAAKGFFGDVDKRYKLLFDASTNRDRNIIPDRLVCEFADFLQKVVDRLLFNITLRRHGTAVQMDVYSPHGSYSVNMVPSFEIEGGFL